MGICGCVCYCAFETEQAVKNGKDVIKDTFVVIVVVWNSIKLNVIFDLVESIAASYLYKSFFFMNVRPFIKII